MSHDHTPNSPETPAPAPTPAPTPRELAQTEIIQIAQEMSLEAALKKRNAGRLPEKDHRRWFLHREAEALERWAFRLTQIASHE